jgi:hypothetical protein
MNHIVTYSRTPISLPDGRLTTDSFAVVDRSATPHRTVSRHASRTAALDAADQAEAAQPRQPAERSIS